MRIMRSALMWTLTICLHVDCLQENDYLQECLEVVQQEFMIFNREK